VRVARLPRLYRLIKMTKLARFGKLFKHKKNARSRFRKYFKFSEAMNRLIWFIITFCIIIHLVACFWGLIGQLESDSYENWIFANGFLEEGPVDLW
jgi:hypothetical protein